MRINIPQIITTLPDFLTANPSETVINFNGIGFIIPRVSFDALFSKAADLPTQAFSFTLNTNATPAVVKYTFTFDPVDKSFYITTHGDATLITYIYADNRRVYDGINPLSTAAATYDQAILDMFSPNRVYADLSNFGVLQMGTIPTDRTEIDKIINIGIQALSSTPIEYVNTHPEFNLNFSGMTSRDMYDTSKNLACDLGAYMLSTDGEDYRYGICSISNQADERRVIYQYTPVYFNKVDYTIDYPITLGDANAITLYDINDDEYGLVQLVDFESKSTATVIGGISGVTSNGVKLMPNAQGIVEINGTNLFMTKDNSSNKKASKK
jgi:hypothetical protein